MTAALVAAHEGLRVVLCEKSGQVGGTSATSAGTLWVPGNTQSRRAGFDDSADKARAYLDALLEGPEPRALRAAFLASAAEAIDYLEARTEVRFLPTGRHPDYRELPGAAVAGRGLIPVPFDGRLLGAEFARVRPPIEEFMLLGGMMITKADIGPLLGRFRSLANFAHAARLLLRYAADRSRYPRGTRLTMGNALVARLYYSLRERAVPVLFDAAIEELLRENGRVAAARVRQAATSTLFKVRKGVVLATGGFGQNRELRARFMPQPVPEHSMAHADNTGDGLALASSVGGQIRHQRGAGLWTPASVTRRRDGSRGLYPHFLYDRAKPGLIAVNQAGRRFVNEGCSYHDFVEAMYASHRSVRTIPAYLVCEASFVAAYGLGAIHPGTRNLAPHVASGYVVQAASIAELARKLQIDAAGLQETVARHNGFAATGVDLDFGKGSTELNRFNGDESLPGNPCLRPILEPPFVAMAVWPADISVATGLATDEHARVLDGSGTPIAGLYACGNDMASVFAGHYPGPGTTLGPAVTFGYRAALHARSTR
jgi:succinate dehydrogenase/fumarate reductase flavoprotein subunit